MRRCKATGPGSVQVIMVGAPAAEVTFKDSNTSVQLSDPFKEVDHCWDHVEFIDVIRYHVDVCSPLSPLQCVPGTAAGATRSSLLPVPLITAVGS